MDLALAQAEKLCGCMQCHQTINEHRKEYYNVLEQTQFWERTCFRRGWSGLLYRRKMLVVSVGATLAANGEYNGKNR